MTGLKNLIKCADYSLVGYIGRLKYSITAFQTHTVLKILSWQAILVEKKPNNLFKAIWDLAFCFLSI